MSVPTAVASVVVVARAIVAAELGSVVTAPIAAAAVAAETAERQRGLASTQWVIQLFGTAVAVVVIAAVVAVAEVVVAEFEAELVAVGTADAA